MVGTIGTTAGLSVIGGGLYLFLGGIVSIPWMTALATVIWFRGGWIERHPFIFAFTGPIIVCGTYTWLAGAFLDAVAISCVTSSAFYLLLVLWGNWRRSMTEKAQLS